MQKIVCGSQWKTTRKLSNVTKLRFISCTQIVIRKPWKKIDRSLPGTTKIRVFVKVNKKIMCVDIETD